MFFICQFVKFRIGLLGQFPRRRQNKRIFLRVIRQPGRQRKQKSKGFTCSRLGGCQHILSAQGRSNRSLLYGGWLRNIQAF